MLVLYILEVMMLEFEWEVFFNSRKKPMLWIAFYEVEMCKAGFFFLSFNGKHISGSLVLGCT